MTPFVPGIIERDAVNVAAVMRKFKVDEPTAKKIVAFNKTQRLFINDTYQVAVRSAFDGSTPPDGWPEMLWLSIRRLDRQPVHDWRDLQAIKNELVGPEHEAVELYPAESRLMDSANQYHLWALKSATLRFPFGFQERMTATAAEAAAIGACQRDPKQP